MNQLQTALQEAGVAAPVPATPIKPKVVSGVPLNSARIAAFFDGSAALQVAERVAKAEGSHLQALLAMIQVTDLEAIKKACSEYVAEVGAALGWKGGKGAGTAPLKVKTARVRMAELKVLSGAVRLAGLTVEGDVGYHPAVMKAREVLEAKGITWKGEKILDAAGKALEKVVSNAQDRNTAASAAIGEATRLKGSDLTDVELKEIHGKAETLRLKAIVVKMAETIISEHGKVHALAVAIEITEQCGKAS